MAEKTIAIKVELKGTSEQQKKLAKLETEVKKLTNRRRDLNKALKEGTISTSKYGAEIARVNTKLKAYRREMLVTRENILGLDSFTKKLGKSFARLGTSIGGAFVGLFAVQKFFQVVSDGVRTIAEFEQQMANVKAVTGATASEFAQLEKLAKDLGASTQFTASEVAQLEEEYAKLGFTTDEILDAAEATLELATATGSDLAQSAKVAAATLNGFGLEAEETQRVVDVMAKSFTSSALDLSKFETAMAAVAPVAATVGMSIEETTASLGVLVDAGFDASTAGTALRNILLDTQKAGISVSEAFTQIKDSADPSTVALDLFGKRGAAVALTLADSTDKTSDFTRELRNAQGAASAMARIVGDTLEGDVKRLNSAWEGLVLNLGESGEDLFRDIVQGATELIGTLGSLTENIHTESEAMTEQQVRVNALFAEVKRLKEGDENRLKILNEIDSINPKILEGLDKQKASTEDLTKAQNQYNDEMIKNIIIQEELEKLEDKRKDAASEARVVIKKQRELDELLAARKVRNLKLIAEEETKFNKLSQSIAKEELKILKDQTLTSNQQLAALLKREKGQSRLSETVREGLALQAQIIKAENSLKESMDEVTEASDRLEDTKKRLNISSKENNEETGESIDLTKLSVKELEKLNTAEAQAEIARRKSSKSAKQLGIDLALINEELEELEDAFGTEDVDDFEKNYGKKTDAIDKFTEAIKDQLEAEEKLEELIGEQQLDKVTGDIAKREKDIEDEAAFQQRLRQLKVDFAAETAEALVGVAGNRIERQKTLELDALNAQLENELISQEEFEKKREAIERKAFNKQKRLQIAQVAISLATELANIAANSAGNPLNAFTAGTAGAAQNIALAKIAIARSAVQTGIIASQQFAEGGFTGDGFGSPDSTGFKPAGVVHEGEYVVPKRVLESQKGGRLVGALESMRLNKPTPLSSIGFANGGFTGGASSMDLTDLENRIAMAVSASMSSIQVVNNATDTVSEAVRVSNIQSEATFG